MISKCISFLVSKKEKINHFINDKVSNVSLDSIDVSKYNVIIFPVGGVSSGNCIKCFYDSF